MPGARAVRRDATPSRHRCADPTFDAHPLRSFPMSCSFRHAARSAACVLVLTVAVVTPAATQQVTTGLDSLPAALSAKVRAAVLDVMARTRVPSGQVGI